MVLEPTGRSRSGAASDRLLDGASRSRRGEQEPPASVISGMRFHHVGVAVKSIPRALDYYLGVFGFRQVGDPVEVPPEHVRVCFIEADPGVQIELIEGLDEQSPVKEILSRVGAGTYHICYQVNDLDQAVATLRRHRCFLVRRFDLPEHGRFAFLLTPDRQLFELCETGPAEVHEP